MRTEEEEIEEIKSIFRRASSDGQVLSQIELRDALEMVTLEQTTVLLLF